MKKSDENKDVLGKIDVIDKKLDIIKLQLNTEFKKIEYSLMDSRANSIAYAMLTVGTLSLALLVALKEWIFVVIAVFCLFSGMILQLHTKVKIRKMKKEDS